jgi:hypothetical protein
MSDEARFRISQSKIGWTHSDASRERMRIAKRLRDERERAARAEQSPA